MWKWGLLTALGSAAEQCFDAVRRRAELLVQSVLVGCF